MEMEEFLQKRKESVEANKIQFQNSDYSIALMQVREDAPERRDICYESYENAVKYMEKQPDSSMYEMVFSQAVSKEFLDEIIRVNSNTSSRLDAVGEYVFEKMNQDSRPEDYYGTSAKVSDVVIIKQQDEITALYVNPKGFLELNHFMTEPNEPNQTQKNTEMEKL